MSGTIRLGLLFALTLLLAGCSLIHVSTCTYWNVLPAMGIDWSPPVCPGGQPTLTVKPPALPVATPPIIATRAA